MKKVIGFGMVAHGVYFIQVGDAGMGGHEHVNSLRRFIVTEMIEMSR